jgi:pimeloyl-ACP methyl ester carboxylesterase
MNSRTADVNGIPMRWLEAGDGVPVVLVHGIPTSPALWRHVIPRLEGVRALAWEMVGYGASIPAGREREISVAQQAEYLRAWIAEMKIGRPVLAGHDLGGGVVQILAARHPEIASGLFLTNSIGYDSWPIPEAKLMRSMGDLVRHLPNSVFRLIYSAFLRRAHDDQQVAAESIDAHWQFYDAHEAAAAFIRQVRSLDVGDTLAVQDQLPALNLPARVVWGTADPFQKLEYGERFARDLGTTLQRIPGAKHFTPEDHPAEIAAAINDLVAEVRAGQR